LRRGLLAIRKAMGERFILGCTAPLGQAVGIMNGELIGVDITPYWQPERKFYKEAPTVPNVCRNIINRSYMNGRLWISDPDTHIARNDNNKLTESEVLLWTFAIYLTGGMILLSDRFSSLTPERMKLSQLLLAEPGIPDVRPLDFFE
jgi:alpha-galactosidase